VALLLFLRFLQQPKSFALLLIGHVVLTLPYVLLIVQARLVGIKKEYEEAAKSLGRQCISDLPGGHLPAAAAGHSGRGPVFLYHLFR
jgi:ABC-type spermidine/putrescine transport system permease subunit II